MNRTTDFVPFARPSLGREEEEAVLRVLRSGWLTSGPEVQKFEEEFAGRLGVRHAVAVKQNSNRLQPHVCFGHIQVTVLGSSLAP